MVKFMLIGKNFSLQLKKNKSINMNSQVPNSGLLQESQARLRSLSPGRLRVANDFLTYLQEREENEATQELLEIPGFLSAFRRAAAQAEAQETVLWEDVQRKV